jgi:hypothetical protein
LSAKGATWTLTALCGCLAVRVLAPSLIRRRTRTQRGRGLSPGDYRLALLWHAGYLLARLVAALFFAYRRLEKTLRQ